MAFSLVTLLQVATPFQVSIEYFHSVLIEIPSDYEYVAIVTGVFGDWVETVLDYYPVVWGGDNTNVTSLMLNDYMFLCASRKTARLAVGSGISSTYYYQFTRQPPF